MRTVLLLITAFSILSGSLHADAKVWRVEQDGSGDFESIYAAVNQAAEGDLIQIGPGTYHESVPIDQSLSLLGSGAGETIVAPAQGTPAFSLNTGGTDSYVLIYEMSIQGGSPAIQGSWCSGIHTLVVYSVEMDQPETYGVQMELCEQALTVFAADFGGLAVDGAPQAAVQLSVPDADYLYGALGVYASEFVGCGEGVDVEIATQGVLAIGLGQTFHANISDTLFQDIAGQAVRMDLVHYFIDEARPAINLVRNRFVDCGAGAHLYCGSSTIVGTYPCTAGIANNVFDRCDGPAVMLETGNRGAFDDETLILNNTLVKGQSASDGHGVFLKSAGNLGLQASLVSNIIHANQGHGVYCEGPAITGDWLYNNVTYNASPGAGSHDGFPPDDPDDPQFDHPLLVSCLPGDPAADDDLHLQTVAGGFPEDSPCLDAGSPELDHQDPDGTRNDMGAYGGPYAPAGETIDADGDGYTPILGDCDDSDPDTSPGGSELPYDGIDQDCDGYDQVDVDADSFRGGESDGVLRVQQDGAAVGEIPAAEVVTGDDYGTLSAGFSLINLEAWVRFTGDTGEDQVLIQVEGDNAGEVAAETHLALLYHQESGSLGAGYVRRTDLQNWESVFVGVPFDLAAEAGQWHHVSAIMQATDGATNVRFYLDGRIEESEIFLGEVSGRKTNVTVGAAQSNQGLVNRAAADIDDVLIQLNPTRTGDFDLPGRPVASNGCGLLWTFDQGQQLVDDCGGDPGSLLGLASIEPRAMDCDDDRSESFPGAVEICDLLDNDCDGVLPADEEDLDQDEFGICNGDCDDEDPAAWPGNPEVCDGADNDCNGQADDGLDFDEDGDGHLAPVSCAEPADDCDDQDAAVHPDAAELCDDSLDNDCDGALDMADGDCEGWEPPIEEDEYVGYACECSAVPGKMPRASLLTLGLLALLLGRRRNSS